MRGVRPLIESVLLHGLLVGGLAFAVGTVAPPAGPALIKLDFRLTSLPADGGAPPPRTATPGPGTASRPLPRPKPPVPPRPRLAPLPPVPKPVPAPEPLPAAAPIPSPESLEAVPQLAPPTQVADSRAADKAVATTPESVAVSPAPDVSANPGSGEAWPDAAELATDGYRTTNVRPIRDAIVDHLRYPLLARRQGWSGRAEVSFRINTAGELLDLRIATSSGYPLLDEQALNAVRKAAPFPPPPVVAQLIIPVSFELN